MANRTFEQLIQELRTRGVSERLLNDIAQQSTTAMERQFDAQTVDPATVSSYFERASSSLENYRSQLEGIVNVDEEVAGLYDEELDVLRNIIDSEISSQNRNEQRLESARERYKEVLKQKKAKEKFFRGIDKGEAAAEQLLQATIGLSKEWEFLSSGQGMKGLAKGLAGGMMKSLSLANIFMSVAQKIVERSLAFDKASSDLFRKTAIDKSTLNLTKMANGLKGMGVDMEKKVATSVGELQTGFRAMGELGDDQLELTAHTITVLDAFGVSNANTVQTFGILTKTLGQTPEQANRFLNNATAIATELSRPPSELLNDFVQAAPILARFGDDSVKVFKDVSLQATLLEMDVAKLVGLSEGMDTFEGAAKAAQAFNVAIGAPFLSAQALLAADPAQKLQLVADAYDRAGRTPLQPRMMRSLASDLGVNPAELTRILNQNTAGFEEKRNAVDNTQALLSENVAKATRNMSAMDKITASMQHIIDSLVEAIDGDRGLAKAADYLTTVAIALTGDADLKRAAEARKKIEKEGGLVNVGAGTTGMGDKRYYSKKQIAEARATLRSGKSLDVNNEALEQFLRRPDYGGKSLVDMEQKQYEELMERARTRNLADKDLVSTAAKARNLGTEIDSSENLAAVGLLIAAGIVASTGVGIPAAAGILAAGATAGYSTGKVMDYSDAGRGVGGGGYIVQDDAMATPMSVGNNYVQPVFNKKDKFYAAKDGGAIANALDEVLGAVDKLIEEKQDVNLDINERKLAQAVDNAFSAIQRRTV